jgi:hypothetical protein
MDANSLLNRTFTGFCFYQVVCWDSMHAVRIGVLHIGNQSVYNCTGRKQSYIATASWQVSTLHCSACTERMDGGAWIVRCPAEKCRQYSRSFLIRYSDSGLIFISHHSHCKMALLAQWQILHRTNWLQRNRKFFTRHVVIVNNLHSAVAAAPWNVVCNAFIAAHKTVFRRFMEIWGAGPSAYKRIHV